MDDQERRCVEAACERLADLRGGTWWISSNLEDQHRPDPVPEVIVTNGSETAAVEVKRVVRAERQAYLGSTLALRSRLTPTCRGHYHLIPPLGFHMPMRPRPVRRLEAATNAVAPALQVGEWG